ncbi:MAG: SDR family oxidoreductase [Acidobacteria bacterium]|nr:SDR family oxidoreductase [Acidobacteriota bacterium]
MSDTASAPKTRKPRKAAAPGTRTAPKRSPRKQAAGPVTEAEHTVLFTGFPGFIGARLIPRLLELRPDTLFHCLVQEKFVEMAKTSIADLDAQHPGLARRMNLVVGDITAPGLGLAEQAAKVLKKSLTGCYHLAAVYDLTIAREIAMRINVEGTRNVLEFLSECPKLTRFDYVSTAYVSGTAVGLYRETDLDVGQRFKNYYEETKFLAEVAVVDSGLPTTIYRPGIVVGDSKTGVTAKFDGPYYALNAMKLLPSPGVFMKVGSGKALVSLVPVDFVLEGIARLSTWEGAVGVTYNLTDPHALSAYEIEELFAKSLGKAFVYLPVPIVLAKLAFAPKPVQKYMGMPGQSLDYFDHPCRYDATNATRDLAQFGVSCPRFDEYVQTLVNFYLKKSGEITRGAMI